jgi:hypothetical protein
MTGYPKHIPCLSREYSRILQRSNPTNAATQSVDPCLSMEHIELKPFAKDLDDAPEIMYAFSTDI